MIIRRFRLLLLKQYHGVQNNYYYFVPKTARRYLTTNIVLDNNSDEKMATSVNDAGIYSWENIQYYTGKGECPVKHSLDIFIPSEPFPRPKLPVCIFYHGGAWTRGDKRNNFNRRLYKNVAEAFCRHKMIVVLANYRLSPEVMHPEHAKDVARSMTWVHRHIGTYGGDSNSITLMGHSAGAHLAAFCLSDHQWLLEQGLQTAAAAEAIKHFVGISGLYNLDDLVSHPFGPLMIGNEVFGPLESTLWTTASPIQRCSDAKKCPLDQMSVLLVTAEQDWPQLASQAEDFIEVLKKRASKGDQQSKRKAVRQSHAVIPTVDHLSIINNIGEEQDKLTPVIVKYLMNAAEKSADL
mmetsp:Transcript_3352/g.4718  ORF Transcript_3352/g.4718 Transcript_3352/m.4718 type:complete len:351 (+) Transcript_3352:110-1162(+)